MVRATKQMLVFLVLILTLWNYVKANVLRQCAIRQTKYLPQAVYHRPLSGTAT
jgi:hypothetical protein